MTYKMPHYIFRRMKTSHYASDTLDVTIRGVPPTDWLDYLKLSQPDGMPYKQPLYN
jgi:hypothetical protein